MHTGFSKGGFRDSRWVSAREWDQPAEGRPSHRFEPTVRKELSPNRSHAQLAETENPGGGDSEEFIKFHNRRVSTDKGASVMPRTCGSRHEPATVADQQLVSSGIALLYEGDPITIRQGEGVWIPVVAVAPSFGDSLAEPVVKGKASQLKSLFPVRIVQ